MSAVPEISELPPGVKVGSPEVIGLLEQALGEAKAGRVAGVGLVLVRGPGGIQAQAAGQYMPEVFMGCDLVKDAIRQQMSGKRSGLWRPNGG